MRVPFVSRADISFSTYDAIIVGSGPAGGSLAQRLSLHDWRVLVIETGSGDFRLDIQDDFGMVQGWGHYDGSHWGNHWTRMLGGTSNLWGGWCAPLTERNFSTWPITRPDLDQYYNSAADTLSVSKTALSFSRDILGAFEFRLIADPDVPLIFSDPIRFPTYQDDPNVHVLLEHSVGPLVPNDLRTGVGAFKLYSLASATSEFIKLGEKQALILAAGGIGNAQILLGSHGADGTAVGNEYDQVGLYLQEHPHLTGGKIVCLQGSLIPDLPSNIGLTRQILQPNDALFYDMSGLDVCLVLRPASIDRTHPVERYLVERFGKNTSAFGIDVMAEMAGRPENRVMKTSETDPSGLPKLTAKCVIDAGAFETADRTIRELGTALLASDIGRVRIDSESIFSGADGGGHTMGTTRMGEDRKTSVVDADCRVHGYRNLFVAGSSVFASGGCVNPTLTIVALAQRLGDHLVGDQ